MFSTATNFKVYSLLPGTCPGWQTSMLVLYKTRRDWTLSCRPVPSSPLAPNPWWHSGGCMYYCLRTRQDKFWPWQLFLGSTEKPAWLTYWLAVWLTGWLADWKSECLNVWLADWLVDYIAVWLADWLFDWLSDCLIGCLTGWLAVGLTDWLSDWLIGCLTGCLTGWLAVWLSCCLTGWLSDWLTVWLADCLSGWLFGWLTVWLLPEAVLHSVSLLAVFLLVTGHWSCTGSGLAWQVVKCQIEIR